MKRIITFLFSIAAFFTISVAAQISGRLDGMRFVPNVEEQFRALADQRADAMGFHKDGTPDPGTCKHYQAIQRFDAADGTPYFFVTRSGNEPFPGCVTGADGVGNLIIVRMGSRDKNGERLRSNRLRRNVHVNDTSPPEDDAATTFYSFVHGGLVFRGTGLPPKAYGHPGGMALIGNVLAVAVEGRYEDTFNPGYPVAPDPTLIMFLDVTNPENPQFLSQFPLRHPEGDAFETAGVVAITPLANGLYLMAVTGGDGEAVHFFRSTTSDLKSEALSWEFVDKTFPEVDDDGHQTLQFLRQGDISGPLYLAAVRGHPVFGSDHDKLDLYHVECQIPNCDPGVAISQPIRFHGRVFVTFPNTGGDRLANGAAASGFHISPTGELILYVTEHDNDGPSGTVKMGEYAHRDQFREESPAYLPTALVNPPIEIDEGQNATLTGEARPPLAKPWFQAYHGTEFRGFSPMVDYGDYDLDNFDDFSILEFLLTYPQNQPPEEFHHANQARSWRWFAPVGCTIVAYDRAESGGTTAVLLDGNGSVQIDPDLNVNYPEMYEQLDSVDFLEDCDSYYAMPFSLEWDLDLNGSFEADGSPVTFIASSFDGPSQINVPARARHSSGGQTGQAFASVTVLNVAPSVSPIILTDSAGNVINSTVPFVLTGVPVNLAAGFTDPGVLDHQTAAINWGDGVVESNTSFTLFDEAFGDRTGSAADTHSYANGGTFTLALSVMDDDGGAGTQSVSLRVLTPEQAVIEVIDMLDAMIASANGSVRTDLEMARRALAGNPYGSNGALEKIRNGQWSAARAFLNQAINNLRDAQAGGADTAALIALLEQIIAPLPS